MIGGQSATRTALNSGLRGAELLSEKNWTYGVTYCLEPITKGKSTWRRLTQVKVALPEMEDPVNKTVRRATLVLALTPVLAMPATAAFAGVTAPTGPTGPTSPLTKTSSTTTTVTPAPGAAASASAVKITGIVTVGGTDTSADGSGGSASADALD